MGKMINHFEKKSVLFMLVFMLIFMNSAMAAVSGKIAGSVIDNETGENISGANVVIVGTTMGAATDENGDYYIINISPGTYSVRVTMMGYTTITKTNVNVMIDQTTRVDFQLEPATVQGEEITVFAKRAIVDKDITGSQETINAGSIERSPVIDLNDAVSQKSGVYNTGETSYFRGGLASEVKYNIDGASLNSGLLSDNWQRLNTSAIQEISISTGGYNAEYGNAMSGVINVVTKEPDRDPGELHGTVRYRMRPAGQYHWGPNMYSNDLWKYTHFDLEYWESELESETKRNNFAQYFQRFYGWDGEQVPNAQELLETYREQINPDDVLANYTERPEHEFEGTVYGAITKDLTFLFTGRYKRGVNIYPQAQKYNPEYNVQAKLNYHLSSDKKLTLNLLRGWYNSATYTESNWNNMESSQESRWQPNSDVRSPYTGQAYAPWGGYWLKGPEEKTLNSATLKWEQTLSPSTFYTVQFSYLQDDMTSLQDYSKLETSTDQVGWGNSWFDLGGNFRLESRQIQVNNYSTSKVFNINTDLTSQIHKSHQIQSGAEFKFYDLNYEHYYMEFPAGDIWHLDNVFDGKPVEGAIYVQDKMEYEGLIVNIGLRIDAFNALHNYAGNIYDPLGYQDHNGGVDGAPSNTAPIWQAHRTKRDWFAEIPGVSTEYQPAFEGNYNDKMPVESEWKFALSPRIGLSFPITENSKLRFNYGHFYQRPSWLKILGFPTSWYESSPYASVRMDQWQGYYGHPGLTYEQTIQYEIGYDQNLFDIFRIAATAYYKDAKHLNRFSHNSNYNQSGGGYAMTGWGSGNMETFSKSRNIANDGHDNIFYTNNAFKDVRGIELTLDKLFNRRWSANLTFNYGLSSGGVSGYWMYYEDASRQHQPHSFTEQKSTWISNTTAKGQLQYVTPEKFAMGILGNISIGIYHEYFTGPQYTWYPKDYSGLMEPNNKRWYPHNRTDLKFTKRVALGKVEPVIGLEIINLFNNYDRVLLSGDDLDAWEEDQTKPKDSRTGENTIWSFYNSISNPKRMVYLNVSFDF